MAMREWAMGLADLKPEQIRHGINSLRGDWPPTLPEFHRLCTGRGNNDFGLDYLPEVYRTRENRPERLLTGPRDDQRGKQEIAKLKELLAGKNKAPSEDEALSASRTVTTTAMHDEHSRRNEG